MKMFNFSKMKFCVLWWGYVVLSAVTLVGCAGSYGHLRDGSDDMRLYKPVTIRWDGLFGQVGIPFVNGVECLGEQAHPLGGHQVFVSPDGEDGNTGTSAASPLRSLASALCNLQPGQTLNILPGTYRESVIMGAFGDSDAAIIIRGVVEGDRLPVLEGENSRSMGIALVESQNIVVKNLEFRNYSDEGLYILTGSEFVIRDNRFVDNGRFSTNPDAYGEGFGVNVVGARSVLIEGNQVLGNGPSQIRREAYILGTGINTFELFDAIIRDNYIAETIGGGILVEDGSGVLVENNTIENNELDANGDYWDGGIWVDGSTDVVLRGNTIRDNHGPGLNLSDEDVQFPEASKNIIVEDNTLANNLYGIYTWNFGSCPPPEEAIFFINNHLEENAIDYKCSEWECGESEPCQ